MPLDLDILPSGNFATLVELRWGASLAHAGRYTTWDVPITVGADTYLPEPRLAVEAQTQTGAVRDEPFTFTMPLRDPLDKLVRPYEHAPVQARIMVMDPEQADPPRVEFAGRVGLVTPNAQGIPGLVKVSVSGRRAGIQYPYGPECGAGCRFILGDARTCKKNLTAFTQTATITSVSGTLLSAPSLAVPDDDLHYLTFGFVEFDGLRIMITDGSRGGSLLRLKLRPPPEWVGVTATFVAGCDGQLVTCRTRFNNEARYFGLGDTTPDYQPVLGSK